MVDDVNEKVGQDPLHIEHNSDQHVEAWSTMLAASKPPIDSTPITPFMDEHAFKSGSERLFPLPHRLFRDTGIGWV